MTAPATNTVDDAARAAVQTWLESLSFTVTPELVTTLPPNSGDVYDALPALAAVWIDTMWEYEDKSEAGAVDGRTVYSRGTVEAPISFAYRCGSRNAAEVARAELRTHLLEAGDASGNIPDTPAFELDATWLTHPFPVTVNLEPGDYVRGPGTVDGVTRNYWVAFLVGQVEYPLLTIEAVGAETGTMDVGIELTQGPESRPGYVQPPFKLNDLPDGYVPPGPDDDDEE